MKKLYTHLLGVAGLSVVSVGVCNAQTGTLALKAPAKAVVIDGASSDWGDSLSYFNADKKIHYAITNDKTTLYLVVKTKDVIQQDDILGSGLTFSINTKGKKSSSYSTTFPQVSANPQMAILKPGEDLEAARLRANVTKYRKIAVSGFKDISEDDVTTSNNYGIKAMIGYDDDGGLVFEESIPLDLFHAGDLAKGEWAFNIKINGLENVHLGSTTSGPASAAFGKAVTADNGRSTLAGSRGGGGGGGGRKGGADASASLASSAPQSGGGTNTPSIDFWGKFTLAQ